MSAAVSVLCESVTASSQQRGSTAQRQKPSDPVATLSTGSLRSATPSTFDERTWSEAAFERNTDHQRSCEGEAASYLLSSRPSANCQKFTSPLRVCVISTSLPPGAQKTASRPVVHSLQAGFVFRKVTALDSCTTFG